MLTRRKFLRGALAGALGLVSVGIQDAKAELPDYCEKAVPVQICADTNNNYICDEDEQRTQKTAYHYVWETMFPTETIHLLDSNSPRSIALHNAVGRQFYVQDPEEGDFMGRVYECTLAKAKEANNTELVDIIEKSDTVWFDVDDNGIYSLRRDVATDSDEDNSTYDSDRVFLDTVADIYVPHDEIRKDVPKELPNDEEVEIIHEEPTTEEGREVTGRVLVGGHHYGLKMNGETYHRGPGAWVEGEIRVPVSEDGNVVAELHRSRYTHAVTQSDDVTNAYEVDASVSYEHMISDSTGVRAGVNVDARSGKTEAYGATAVEGQLTAGPEIGVHHEKGRSELDVRASVNPGQVTTKVEGGPLGEFDTNDPLTKIKAEAEYLHEVVDGVRVGGLASMERDAGEETVFNPTGRNGTTHKSATLLKAGPKLEAVLAEHAILQAGLGAGRMVGSTRDGDRTFYFLDVGVGWDF